MSPSYSSPPVAPSIAAQQVPMAQFAQQQQQQGGAPGGGSPSDSMASMALVQSLLTGVGQDLERIAKVIVVDKPELSPILKQAVNALSMLMNEVTKAASPDQGAATQAQQMPDSGAVSAGQ